ncbi:MAG: ATP-binding protein [Bacteroidales bacterium]|nr:ATP-binding protein [Bacteroidales bacterium]
MAILKVKNFGVIGENPQDKEGFFSVNFSPVTIFIGKQASGKSTIAKLISIFSWLEKKLIRDGSPSSIEMPTVAFENLCKQQETKEYFHSDTKISYNGNAYTYKYDRKENIFTAKKSDTYDNYILPKIQYITSARNLLTMLYEIELPTTTDQKGNIINLASNIPYMVNDLNGAYTQALKELAKNGFSLPINDISVFYQNHSTYIKANGNDPISMPAASSGIQSITPLLIVSRFLSNEVKKDLSQKLQTPINEISKKQMENEILKENVDLYKTYSNLKDGFFHKDDISQSEKDNISKIEKISQKFIPSCFYNIVEEPEQNLFPETQADVLYELLECKNANIRNKLVISTHSPYILTALNNAMLASDVYSKTGETVKSIPLSKMVSFDDVSAYKLEDGKIISITDIQNRLIDASQIDDCSSQINEVFDELMDLYDGQSN